jgi:prephenate dehydrogenase
MSPETHDTAFAAVSHLPHLLAFAMMNGVLAQPEAADCCRWPAPAFATSPASRRRPRLWRDVLLANREEVLAQSRHFQQALQQLEQAMLADDDQALQALLTRASDARLHWTMGQPPAARTPA